MLRNYSWGLLTNRALAALFALALSGCANTAWQASSGGPGLPAGPPPAGGSVRVVGVNSSFGGWLGLGILAGAAYGSFFYPVPEMAPDRRVVEHDCSKPIEDSSANLRCR